VLPTESPAAEAGNLPPGCEPINLRSPAGEAVNLTGVWIQDEEEGPQPARWLIRALGDCIWGTGTYDTYTEEEFLARSDSIQVLQGRVGNDFVIEGTIVLLGPHLTFATPEYFSEVRLLIEFDQASEITLREDRIPGVEGPRCPDPVTYCPAPLLLRPSSGAGN
jgi:hypothetical protein